MKTINIDTVGRGIQNAYDRGNYAIEHMPPELKPPLHCVAIFDIGDLGFLYMPSMHHIVFKQYPVLDEAMQKNVQADVALMGKAGKCELVTILVLAFANDDMEDSTKKFLIKRCGHDTSLQFVTKYLQEYAGNQQDDEEVGEEAESEVESNNKDETENITLPPVNSEDAIAEILEFELVVNS